MWRLAAAQALLNVSESTVSTHMHDLETRLGLRLCQRGRGGFRLTADGEAVYRSARELFAPSTASRPMSHRAASS